MAKYDAMNADSTSRLAREVRAARAYGGLSRLAAARAMDLTSAEQIGRYERGEQTPRPLQLEGLARAAGIPPAYLAAGFLAPEDPATRFADATRREAARHDEHPGSGSEAHRGEDDAGEGQ